jgi:hypothetical protein
MVPIKIENDENKFQELGLNEDYLINRIQNWDLIYTFNLHGKSKYYGVWNLNQLLNLLKIIEIMRNTCCL